MRDLPKTCDNCGSFIAVYRLNGTPGVVYSLCAACGWSTLKDPASMGIVSSTVSSKALDDGLSLWELRVRSVIEG